MTESEATNEDKALELLVGQRVETFTYKAVQLVLSQPFRQPLEFDAFRIGDIGDSLLGQELAALTLSHLPLSSSGSAMPKELVAAVAKELSEELKTELSRSIDLDTLFSAFSPERQEYMKEQCQQVNMEIGLLQQMFEGFQLFLDNVANQVPSMANHIRPPSSQERIMAAFYLIWGWLLSSILIMMASYGDEDRSRLQSFQRPEVEAYIEFVMAHQGWGGSLNKAMKLALDEVKDDLSRKKRQKGWKIPGPRYQGSESWSEPHNEEYQVMLIGLYKGLLWAAKCGPLLASLEYGRTGKLRNSLIKAANHNLIDEIRKVNRQRGIKVSGNWSAEGKTIDEIRRLVDQEDRELRGKEVLDFPIEGDEVHTSVLELALDEESYKRWTEEAGEEAEEEREAILWEKLSKLENDAKLTPRQKLMLKMIKMGKDDTEIATALEEVFGKPVTAGNVRKLKHELIKKLKEVDSKK